MAKYLWVYVTDDEYELPIYVCDTLKEMAEYIGTDPNLISCAYSRYSKGTQEKCRFRKILNEREDDEMYKVGDKVACFDYADALYTLRQLKNEGYDAVICVVDGKHSVEITREKGCNNGI